MGDTAQKVAITAATSGLILSVAIPTTAAAEPEPQVQVAAVQETVTADPAAQVDFERAGLSSRYDPEARLQEVTVAAAASSVTPAAAKGTLAKPLNAEMVSTSGFGYRVSPITGMSGELHRGQDFAAACGTDVTAAAAGTVTFAGWHPYGGGQRVVIDHGNGVETTYNHLSAIHVAVGDTMDRGALLGASGSTGASTGCHLHFEVMVNGDVVDPLGWL